jgi:Protein of unknown function (DUF2796)
MTHLYMKQVLFSLTSVAIKWLITLALGLSMSAQAAPHAHSHVHGHILLGIAIDGPTVTVDIYSPMDSLMGFEHAPRTSSEKNMAKRWKQRLQQSTDLLRFNPEAACTLKQVFIDAPLVGLGVPTETQASGHNDLEGNWAFHCSRPEALKQVKLGFFAQSRHAKQIMVRLVTAKRQSQVVLKRPQDIVMLSQ